MRVYDSEAIGADHSHAPVVHSLHQLSLEFRPGRADLFKTSGNNDKPLNTLLAALINNSIYEFPWHDNDRQIHGIRNIEHGRIGLYRVNHAVPGIDGKYLSVEFIGDQIVEKLSTN